MQLPIFLAYVDYCRNMGKLPNIEELTKWKEKYDKR